jgi:hypothetical protein
MRDIFQGANEALVEHFAVIFDEAGKPIGISGQVDGEEILEMGDVEMTMVVKADAFTLTRVHVDQKIKARRLCCSGGRCVLN